MARTQPDRTRREGLFVAAAGALTLVGALACSQGDGAADADPKASAVPAPSDPASADLGSPFSEPVPAAGTPDDLGPDGIGIVPKSAVMEQFAKGVDPSRLTPEALAKNPLVIGVEKRPPFVLAEGADPLDPNSYDWEKDDDGYWIISYSDLSLDGVNKDLLLDALVYPEEYEGESIAFPDRLRALDGEKVALTGYMIATRWSKNRVTNFMLVRDLLACCYGGSPEPDEWVDVEMRGAGAHSYQYVPVVTRGTFHVQGVADDAGYASGAFRLEGDDAREE